MTLSEWIRYGEIRGQVTFSIEDVHTAFPTTSPAVIRTSIQRQIKAGRLLSVHKGFYVVIPPQYALKRVVPVSYYIHNLMQAMGKPYYVALLSAAELHGAGHQRVQRTQVMTILPKSSTLRQNTPITWCYRKAIPSELLCQINTETTIMYYSSAELTAADLVQYADYAGGYQHVATVLAELVEVLQMEKFASVFPYTTIASIQRLGYILEYVLEETEKADKLYQILHSHALPLNDILMRSNKPSNPNSNPNRWRVNRNVDIEIDEL